MYYDHPIYPTKKKQMAPSGFVVLFKWWHGGRGKPSVLCVLLGMENRPRDGSPPDSLAVFGGALDRKHDANTMSTAFRELLEESGITIDQLCVLHIEDDNRLAFRRKTKMSNSWSAMLPDDIGRTDFWQSRTTPHEMSACVYVPVKNIMNIKSDPARPLTYTVYDVDGNKQKLQGRFLDMLQKHIENAIPLMKQTHCSVRDEKFEPSGANIFEDLLQLKEADERELRVVYDNYRLKVKSEGLGGPNEFSFIDSLSTRKTFEEFRSDMIRNIFRFHEFFGRPEDFRKYVVDQIESNLKVKGKDTYRPYDGMDIVLVDKIESETVKAANIIVNFQTVGEWEFPTDLTKTIENIMFGNLERTDVNLVKCESGDSVKDPEEWTIYYQENGGRVLIRVFIPYIRKQSDMKDFSELFLSMWRCVKKVSEKTEGIVMLFPSQLPNPTGMVATVRQWWVGGPNIDRDELFKSLTDSYTESNIAIQGIAPAFEATKQAPLSFVFDNADDFEAMKEQFKETKNPGR